MTTLTTSTYPDAMADIDDTLVDIEVTGTDESIEDLVEPEEEPA